MGQLHLIRFVASSSRLRTVEPKCGLLSILELLVLRCFTQLLAWAAGYFELRSYRNSLDGNSTSGHARHYNPGIQAISNPRARAAASSVPDSDPAILSSSCPDHGAVAEEGLQAPQLIDVPQLMHAMKRLNLPATTLSAIMDAVRESIVVATAGGSHFDSGRVTPCHCCGHAQRYSFPSTVSEILDSTLDRDPEVLRWVQTAFGVQL
eukprot:jgi/Mesvir1/7920/Mv11845-RA.1